MQAAAALMILAVAVPVFATEPPQEQLEFFEREVRPLLAEHCFQCHSRAAKRLEAGLYLDQREGLRKGGDSGPAIQPGQPAESLLIQAVRYESLKMPPRGRLSDGKIGVLVRWVQMGAPWPPEHPTAASAAGAVDWQQRKARHWSWQPIASVAPPEVRNAAWPSNAIDRFILAKLEEQGLSPAPAADQRTLVRRVYFDLIGLPPNPTQVREFLDDAAPDAYEKLVDRLLQSEHYGEKWARHWMDLVRYAETYGHEFDYPIHHAYRYRDYLIRAFNADVPYDLFMTEHVAGDLLEAPRRHPQEGFNESVIGTGFWFLGEAVHAPTDVRGDEAIRIDNQIDVMSKTFLGLTVACARCHDHKFDPISTADYYALSGILQSSRRQEAMLDPDGRIHKAAEHLRALRRQGDEALAAAVTNARLDAGVFTAYLLAAREALLEASSASVPPPASTPASDVPLPTLQAIQRVAAERQLDRDVLQRWVTALAEPATRQPTHPLYAWVTLALKNPAAEGSAFAAQAERLRSELTSQAERAAAAAQQTVLFADLNQGHLDGWFVTGEAFDAAPTRAGQWNAAARKDEFVPAGVAHRGLTSPRLRGVLRSPTFTLTHPQIHYRLCAKDVQVRLVIDGYFMTIFHSLLFNGVALSPVDTSGQFRWQTQGGDLQNYLGHRAYIEIVDHGDGWAAVDEIRFADGGPPPDPPHPDNLQALSSPRIESPEALAGVYESAWKASLARWRQGASEGGDTDLLNWALQHRLVSTETLTASVADKIANIERALPEPTFVLAIADGTGQDGHVNVRGNPANPGDLVPRRFLAAIAGDQQPPIGHDSGRLELARHLTDPTNPFPARVLVNRLWHHLFGRGITPSVDDFGAMGQGPTHPQLLDWLARDFQDHGWSVKRMLRQIVLSSTYRMSSQPGSAGMRAEQADPTNELFHRMPVRRLPAESIRDALLAVSGRLDPTLYGPSVPVHLTPFMEGRGRPGSGPLDGNGRRSVYVEVRRNFLAPMMLAFDAPSPFSTMGRRSVSNVPAQSLILMNDPFVIGQARHWAEGLLSRSATADERIAALFETALARPPSDAQRERIHGFLDQQSGLYGASVNDLRVWTDVCHMILNMKEFVFLN